MREPRAELSSFPSLSSQASASLSNRMRSSKHHRVDANRGISDRLLTLHQRLLHALNLGFRRYDNKGGNLHCTDIEAQRHVIRSISAFLDSSSSETLQHSSVKESVTDIVRALDRILHLRNETIIVMAVNVAVKLISLLPNPVLQTHIPDFVNSLSFLLSFHQSQVAVSCAIGLRLILSKMSVTRENEVWKILDGRKAVDNIVHNIKDYSTGTNPIENCIEMVSLLSSILWRWTSSRYHVWTDADLMKAIEAIFADCDLSAKTAILQLHSSIALCGHGAWRLLENGEALVQRMICCMENSHPYLVRVEGFKLAQCLAMTEQSCLKMMSVCCEPLTKAIVSAMSGWTSHSGKIGNEQMCLLVEACRLALVSRWSGKHHIYFWKHGIEKVLLDLFASNLYQNRTLHLLSLNKQIAVAQEAIKANFLQDLKPYIWNILGWLATHCGEEFDVSRDGDEICVNMLITCACVAFMEVMHKNRLLCQDDASKTVGTDSASRAVLMMMFSPCKHIADHSRCILSEMLKLFGDDHLKYLIKSLNAAMSGHGSVTPDTLQTTINLMGLTCYSCLPQYQDQIIELGGMKTLFSFTRSCSTNHDCIGRSRVALHLRNKFSEQTCCWDSLNDWEGGNIFLLFSLWGLAELIHYVSCRNHLDSISGYTDCSKAQFVDEIQEICTVSLSPGVRWNAAFILCHFGLYGFPSRLGKRISKVFNEGEHADVQLILSNSSLSAHSVILMARCPSLLPCSEKHKKDVHLSACISDRPLFKLLEFVYSGYMVTEDNLVKELKSLARRCNQFSLLQLLRRRRPYWGMACSRFDLQLALGPLGLSSSYAFVLDNHLRIS